MESPMKYFAAMEDHRKQGYVKHPLINIIAISIAAVICGAEDWYDIEDYGKEKYEWLKTFLEASRLTLEGKLIKGNETVVSNDIHKAGAEIVGGFLIIKAENLDEAVAIARTCPIYEFDGYAEVRAINP